MRLLKAGLMALALAAPSFAEKAKPADPAEFAKSDAARPVGRAPEKAEPSTRIVAQREAMKALPLVDGEWRGPSRKKSRDGWVEMIQTQRVSTLLDGTVRVIESKGFEKTGELTFEAFAVVSFDPDAKAYSMRSYSNGRVRDYPVKATADGFSWEIRAGSDLTIRYENAFRNGIWKETATRFPAKGESETYLEFSIKRVTGGTLWSQWKPAKG